METNEKKGGKDEFRGYNTKVTSVSVSRKFQQLLDEYNISPTEAFRRGVAVTLFDLGVTQYQSEKNRDRYEYVKKFMEAMEKDEQIKREYEKMVEFGKIKFHLEDIKKIINAFVED